jgi:putative transposase
MPMPWQETCAMAERMRFVDAVQSETESFAEWCRRFGISRNTGYKWLHRFEAEGAVGLADRSRAPHHCPHALSEAQREAAIVLRARHPKWGPKKIAARWPLEYPQLAVPAPSTIGDVLHDAGLVAPRRRRRHVPPRTEPLAHATGPNAVWCADFKGDFPLGDGTRCYPLTVSDAHSRLLLRCQALPTTSGGGVRPLFEATFREYGLPLVLRTDNGVRFASTAVGGLTALSIWWVRLGIRPERIDPGKPEQNGRHERMHGTLQREACEPPARSLRGQQQRFDAFRGEYNHERPHEALGQVAPATVYAPSPRPYPERLPELDYPDADQVRRVRPNGCMRWGHGGEVYVGQVLAGEAVAVTQIGDALWQVAFGPLVLGTFVPGAGGLLRPRRGRKVSPMLPV